MSIKPGRNGSRAQGVVPRIEIAPKPLRKPARFGQCIPELVPRINGPISQVNDEWLALAHSEPWHESRVGADPADGVSPVKQAEVAAVPNRRSSSYPR